MKKIKVTDPRTGIEYKTIRAMCDAAGIEYSVFSSRRRLGWSLEKCLYGKEKYIDPRTGIEYKTMKSMCATIEVDYKLFKSRKHLGWTLEECLYGRKKGGKHEIK